MDFLVNHGFTTLKLVENLKEDVVAGKLRFCRCAGEGATANSSLLIPVGYFIPSYIIISYFFSYSSLFFIYS